MHGLALEHVHFARVGQARLFFGRERKINLFQALGLEALRGLSLIHLAAQRHGGDPCAVGTFHDGVHRGLRHVARAVLQRRVDTFLNDAVGHERTHGVMRDDHGVVRQPVVFFNVGDGVHDGVVAGLAAVDHRHAVGFAQLFVDQILRVIHPGFMGRHDHLFKARIHKKLFHRVHQNGLGAQLEKLFGHIGVAHAAALAACQNYCEDHGEPSLCSVFISI